MRVHLFTDLRGLLNFRRGLPCQAWATRRSESDIHIDVPLRALRLTEAEDGFFQIMAREEW